MWKSIFSRTTHWTEYSFSIELSRHLYLKINWLYMFESISGSSILLHWSIYLYCFDYLSFTVSLEIRHLIFLLLLKIWVLKFQLPVVNCYYTETQLIFVYWSYNISCDCAKHTLFAFLVDSFYMMIMFSVNEESFSSFPICTSFIFVVLFFLLD